jgi:molybdenum cofactor cytidylyltransferase
MSAWSMAKNNRRVAAVVLAAGRSARMGEPKQLLCVGERTVLERALENVRGAGVGEVVLVLGHSAEEIRRELPADVLDGLNIVLNHQYEEGMASSLREGLSAVSDTMDAALIVLADQPFVRSETIDRIIERYRSSDAEIVIPFFDGQRGNPVLLDRSVFSEAMALQGDTGFRAIFASHADGIGKVDVDDSGILLDIDDRADYERLRGYRG